jgi:hypothetical protein
MEIHKDKVEWDEKKFQCVDDERMIRSIQRENVHVPIGQISLLQANHNVCKGCKGYIIHII